MSRRIARILDEPEPIVSKFLKEIEEKNGFPSHDARFLAENIQRIRSKLAELGLDPDDTTGEELYQALLIKFEKNSRLFDIQFGAEDMVFEEKAAKAAQIVSQCYALQSQWAIKSQIAKNILRGLPPKRVMKHLGYRSIESMLKRENTGELYLAADLLESASWQKIRAKLISRLNQTDFELRPVHFVLLSRQNWSSILGPEDFIAKNYDVQTIGIWPDAAVTNTYLLNLTLLLEEQIQPSARLRTPLTRISGILGWWADMDHLVAELAGESISLNLKDCAANHLKKNSYSDKQNTNGRVSFWRQLMDRYENQPLTEAFFETDTRQRIAALGSVSPPVYEFAEEFDG
jgi:hypothetical protein